ncbi:hypothetical protein LJC24_01435 [Desulfococcaceae bacterium OttesenSCG-928-F15]|nr:hypothetical protein [Desulfococcaceae bacterium OttesenSCG-928-F15]
MEIFLAIGEIIAGYVAAIFKLGLAVIDLLVDGIYALIGKSKKEKSR